MVDRSARARPAPSYLRVKEFVRRRIAGGRWKPGDAVPSEAQLCERFGVSRMTVNRALRELSDEGLIVRVQGSGSFVAQLHSISSMLRLRDIHDEIAERGHRHTTDVLRVGRCRAPADVAQVLELKSGSPVFHSVLVHRENGVPIQYEDRYVNPAAAPGYLDCDFGRVTPTHYLSEHAPITEAFYSIEARLPTAEQARHLHIGPGDACLVVCRRTRSAARMVTVATLVHPGGRFLLTGQFQA
jgi:GntR family histidine utilization transcriptional repressor